MLWRLWGLLTGCTHIFIKEGGMLTVETHAMGPINTQTMKTLGPVTLAARTVLLKGWRANRLKHILWRLWGL